MTIKLERYLTKKKSPPHSNNPPYEANLLREDKIELVEFFKEFIKQSPLPNRLEKGTPFDYPAIVSPPSKKIGFYEFFIIKKVLGEGGEGRVEHSPLSIKIKRVRHRFKRDSYQIHINREKLAIKWGDNTHRDEYKREAELSSNSNNKPEVKRLGDENYMLVMNYFKGRNIKETNYREMTFDEIWIKHLEFAQALASLHEMKKVVHRDIKPANIIDARKEGITIVDYGIAAHKNNKKENSGFSGTLCFMAPEIILKQKTSAASDIYAASFVFAVIAQGNQDKMLEDKVKHFREIDKIFENTNYTEEEANKKVTEILQEKAYNFDSIFQHCEIPEDVDQQLLKDYKDLLNRMQSFNPKSRPDIFFIQRFLLKIPERRKKYRTYLEAQSELKSEFKHQKKAFIKNLRILFPSERIPNNFITENESIYSAEIKKCQKWITLLSQPSANFKSHLAITKKLHENNYGANKEPEPFPVAKDLRKANDDLKAFNETTKAFLVQLSRVFQKFKTNSEGYKEIGKFIGSKKVSAMEKLIKLQDIGYQRTRSGIALKWSLSHNFGKGRNQHMHNVYTHLANITLDETNLKKTTEQLADIVTYIESNKNDFSKKMPVKLST